jgi:hypothetical protein
MLVSVAPPRVEAGNNKKRVIIHVGVPSIWSLAQAHYLLAKMHKDNLRLQTKMPNPDDLDPNGINATRIQILRTLLDIDAQFDQKVGVENQAVLQEQKDKIRQRDQARSQLPKKEQELDELDSDILKSKKRLAKLEADAKQREDIRNAQAKPTADPPVPVPLPDEDERKLQQDIAVLKAEIEEKEKRRADLVTERDALKTQANNSVGKPALTDTPVNAAAGTLPDISAFSKELIQKAANAIDRPRIAASMALDNFVGMQYEIISKQLTLLRDELGPDERLVFLELPSSLYTVACKGDNYIAQVQWKVKGYVTKKKNSSLAVAKEAEETEANVTQDREKKATEAAAEEGEDTGKLNQGKNIDYSSVKRQLDASAKTNLNMSAVVGTLNNEMEAGKQDELEFKDVDASTIRALDIIPRQSALNVNDVQATVNQKNFLGVMKLLIGLGVKVNYQRQKELYEQFLQQEVYASGFGKGLNTFGWTFGPLPGTNRIAPGVRTTYAVLAVPREASILTLEGTGVAFHRKESPKYNLETVDYDPNTDQVVFPPKVFNIIIPSEETQQFKIYNINYTPAKKGEPVTVVIKGDYISPQAGILVDGVPLTKTLAIGNNATLNAIEDLPTTSRVRGQYELVSSKELVMRFSMTDPNYVGTPNITLITPERSAPLNFLPLAVNYHKKKTSLKNIVTTEPMFIDDFRLDKRLVLISQAAAPYIKARLKGGGLRRKADIWVGNKLIPFKGIELITSEVQDYKQSHPGAAVPDDTLEAYVQLNPNAEFTTQIDTGEYFLYFANPHKKTWPVRFRHNIIRGFEAEEFNFKTSRDGEYEVRSYTPNSKTNKATLDVRFFGPQPTEAKISPSKEYGERTSGIIQEADGVWRALFDVKYENLGAKQVERDKVSITVVQGGDTTTHDISIPVRPQITAITISKPALPDAGGSQVTIEGVNLQNVVKVFVAGNEARIIGEPAKDSIVVELSAGAFIKEEDGVRIPVLMVTREGEKVSGVVSIGKPAETAGPAKGHQTKKQSHAKKR